jgi:hypothetical protein
MQEFLGEDNKRKFDETRDDILARLTVPTLGMMVLATTYHEALQSLLRLNDRHPATC